MGKYCEVKVLTNRKNMYIYDALELIGKELGNQNRKYREGKYYKLGRDYVAKRRGRFNKTAVKRMVYSEGGCWKLCEKEYHHFFRVIIFALNKIRKTKKEEVDELIKKVEAMIDTSHSCHNTKNLYSELLLMEQIDSLSITSMIRETSEDTQKSERCKKILEEIKLVDCKYY